MQASSIIEDLEAAGLAEDEASVYVRLLQVGPAKAGQLTQYFEMSRSTLYRLLNELVEEGYVSKGLERPTVYTAIDPEKLFDLGLDEIDRQRDRLTHVRERRLDKLQKIAGETKREGSETTWRKMEGTEQIYEALHSMSEGAEESIWSASNHEVTTARFLPTVEEAWRIVCRRAVDDGVDVRLLFDFQGDPYHHIPDWVRPAQTLDFRQIVADETVHFVLFDEQDLLMWARPAPVGTMGKEDDVAVKTNAQGSVVAHRMLFDELWDRGRPVKLEG